MAIGDSWVLGCLLMSSVVPLLLCLVNFFTWRRPSPRGGGSPVPASLSVLIPASLSVLIPARNEVQRLGPALASALAQGDRVTEVLVFSDGSSDGTDDLVREFASRDARVRLLRGEGLPPGWVGKPHACQQLYERSVGDVLLFLDADVRLLPGAVAGLASELDSVDSEQVLLTGVPRQQVVTFWERLIVPLLHLTYVAWLPLRWAEGSSDPRKVAACGQLMMMRRHVADELGGFRSVAAEVVDDMALCRHARRQGVRVLFVDAGQVAFCRMYDSAAAVWRGFGKNLYEGLGSPRALALALTLYLSCFVLPYLGLVGIIVRPQLVQTLPLLALGSGVGVACNLLLRTLLAGRYRQPLSGILLHPLAIVALCVLALQSFWLSSRGTIDWAGRRYRRRSVRTLARVSTPVPSPVHDSGASKVTALETGR